MSKLNYTKPLLRSQTLQVGVFGVYGEGEGEGGGGSPHPVKIIDHFHMSME